MQISSHFTLEELTLSNTAVRLGIDNSPTQIVIDNLTTLARGLEEVRLKLGVPMHINSGYRCAKLNAAVHGVPTSAHISGFAADFIAPEFGTPAEIVHAIAESSIQFDQLIVECNAWVHISFAPAMRRAVLNAAMPNGTMTYTKGE